MNRKIIVFTKTNILNTYLINFRNNREMFENLPNTYLFLPSLDRYKRIKKMMQSANRIKINKIYK
ncbi:hypothetical protein SAG0136_02345 [Streptococcus agalactiae LMG 14747]|uniref:Uncharacterized protein n=1 Tax=Streptococcus agalactiae LMG 14747 TaxID=1154860 RepID=V6Z3E3_STRAG|nr:hypothetical protein SAG0136_02345 [Streptococcus agalactiae LMG 14747]